MGRLAKNPELVNGVASSATMPGGTTAERPSATKDGQTRWNETLTQLEYYDGSTWQQVGKTGLVTVTKEPFTGTGVQTAFTLATAAADELDLLIFVGGVFQNPNVAYTVSGTTLTFTSAPPNLEAIVVLRGLNEVT